MNLILHLYLHAFMLMVGCLEKCMNRLERKWLVSVYWHVCFQELHNTTFKNKGEVKDLKIF